VCCSPPRLFIRTSSKVLHILIINSQLEALRVEPFFGVKFYDFLSFNAKGGSFFTELFL
jgi:hypothetical protein